MEIFTFSYPSMVNTPSANITIQKFLDETFSELNEISHKVGLAALELGGTCTGEHGVGIGKRQLMALERGAVALDLMKTIKKSVDEKNLMNPGKVIPF